MIQHLNKTRSEQPASRSLCIGFHRVSVSKGELMIKQRLQRANADNIIMKRARINRGFRLAGINHALTIKAMPTGNGPACLQCLPRGKLCAPCSVTRLAAINKQLYPRRAVLCAKAHMIGRPFVRKGRLVGQGVMHKGKRKRRHQRAFRLLMFKGTVKHRRQIRRREMKPPVTAISRRAYRSSIGGPHARCRGQITQQMRIGVPCRAHHILGGA